MYNFILYNIRLNVCTNQFSWWIKHFRRLTAQAATCSLFLCTEPSLDYSCCVIFIKYFSIKRHTSTPGSKFLPDWFVWRARAAASSWAQTWLSHLLGRWLGRAFGEKHNECCACVLCHQPSVTQCKQAFLMLPADGCRWWPGVKGGVELRSEGAGGLAEVHPSWWRHDFKGELSAFVVKLCHLPHTCWPHLGDPVF